MDLLSSRIFWLRSKPPAPSSTPCRARTVTGVPSRSTTAPTTRPPSTTSSVAGQFSHRGTSRSSSDRRRRAMSALPACSLVSRLWFRPLEPPHGVLDHPPQELESAAPGRRQVALGLARRDAELAHHLGLGMRSPQPRKLGPEQRRVERHRLHGPAAGLPAGSLWVVVAVHLQAVEAKRRVCLHPRQHPWGVLHIRLEPRLGDLAPGQVAQVGERLLGGVGHAPRGHLRVAGNPDHTARYRGRTPVLVGCLHDQHVEPEVGRAHRRSQAGRAGADDEPVHMGIQTRLPRPVIRRPALGVARK